MCASDIDARFQCDDVSCCRSTARFIPAPAASCQDVSARALSREVDGTPGQLHSKVGTRRKCRSARRLAEPYDGTPCLPKILLTFSRDLIRYLLGSSAAPRGGVHS